MAVTTGDPCPLVPGDPGRRLMPFAHGPAEAIPALIASALVVSCLSPVLAWPFPVSIVYLSVIDLDPK